MSFAGDEGNDIDDDDDVPLLALRANGAAPNGLLSADGDGDGEDGLTSSGRKRKPAADKEVISPPAKRQNKFKPVKATERCGHCRTCLNPHLKKACETVRSRMGTGVGSTSARSSSPPSPSATTKPLPYTAPSAAIKREPSAASAAAQQSTRQVSGAEAGPGPRSSTSAASAAAAPGSGAVVPPAAACEPSMDAVVKEVTDMVTRNGGVQDVRYVERLAHILSSEDRMSMRLTLMAVLSASSQEVLSKLLHDAQVRHAHVHLSTCRMHAWRKTCRLGYDCSVVPPLSGYIRRKHMGCCVQWHPNHTLSQGIDEQIITYTRQHATVSCHRHCQHV